ncbi:hypothetical protein ACIPVB_11845 [Microbacterium sp. NPDC090007]|uniref:hypothetical protein n=1 Tax=Microbacterium sp. NPDC090007 TaxID=3364204 RepID=UPI00380A584A
MPGEQGWREVPAAGGSVSVSTVQPVAVVRRPGRPPVVASWPDLDLGLRAADFSLHGTRTGAWVVYSPREAEVEDGLAPGWRAAVHIGAEGRVSACVRLEAAVVAGATHHGLWTRRAPAHADQGDSTAPAEDDVRVVRPDGTVHEMHVDRRLAWAFEADGRVHVAVHTGPPRLVEQPMRGFRARTPDGARVDTSGPGRRSVSRSWTQPTAAVPVTEGALPAVWRTHEQQLEPIDDARMIAVMKTVVPRSRAGGPDDPAVSWNPVEMPVDVREACVTAVVQEFAFLASFWTHPSGLTASLSPGMSDPRVDVRGEWPDTRVEVTFRHPLFAEGRVRRTLRVFDTAGRYVPPAYAAVHLFEDLATRVPAAPSDGVDGILDI